MKRILTTSLVAALLVAIMALSPAIAEAHVLKEDNGISSVLHIDPDDNPIAGSKTTLELQFGNSSGDFSLNNYHIGIKVSEDNKTIQTTSVASAYFGSASQGVAYVTFPRIDVYQVTVSGVSNQKAVASFSVNYLVRVATAANGTQMSKSNATTVALLSGTSLILVVMVAGYQIVGGKRYVAPKKKS
jgi:hypothetical protein